MQPRDVMAAHMFADCDNPYEFADDIIERLGEAGYEIVQRYEEPKPWWSMFCPYPYHGEQVVMA